MPTSGLPAAMCSRSASSWSFGGRRRRTLTSTRSAFLIASAMPGKLFLSCESAWMIVTSKPSGSRSDFTNAGSEISVLYSSSPISIDDLPLVAAEAERLAAEEIDAGDRRADELLDVLDDQVACR